MVLRIEARVTRLEEDFQAIGSTVVDTLERVKRLEVGQRKHTEILTEHSAILNEHSATLESHTELLNEILRRLPAPE